MVLDPIPQSLPVHFFGSRPQPPTSPPGGEQTENIWISRSMSFPDRSFEWRGLRLLTSKLVWNFRDSRENVFDMHGDSSENLLDILSFVIVSSPISSVCGLSCTHFEREFMSVTCDTCGWAFTRDTCAWSHNTPTHLLQKSPIKETINSAKET